MNREFLEGIGLEKEAIDKVMAEHGKTLNATKDDLEKTSADRDNLKEQLSERDKQLEELNKVDPEAMKEEITRLKKANDEVSTEYQQKLDKQQFDFALEKAITGEKARNPKAVKALLNTESIKLDGDKLLGLDEQLKGLKESDGYLFGESDKLGGRDPHVGDPENPTNYKGKNPFMKESRNLTEQARLLKDEPELAKTLKVQAN